MKDSVYKFEGRYIVVLVIAAVLLYVSLLRSGSLYELSNGYTYFKNFLFWSSLAAKILYSIAIALFLFKFLRWHNSQMTFYKDKLVFETSSRTITICYSTIEYIDRYCINYKEGFERKKFELYGKHMRSEEEKADIKRLGEKNVKHTSMLEDLLSRLHVRETKKRGKNTIYYIN